MNKNKIVLVLVYGISLLTPVHASVIDYYKELLNSSDTEIAQTYHNAETIDDKFTIALVTGHFDYLNSLPNNKNWLSNALFKSKNTIYVNDFINKIIDPAAQSTPLHIAVQIAGYYQDQKYEATIQKTLVQATMYSQKYHNMIKTIEFLVENKADLNATNRSGQTPLHLAYKNADYTAARILLCAGADTNIQDKYGKTPFQYLSIKPEIDPKRYKIFKDDFEKAQQQNKANDEQEIDKTIVSNTTLQKASKKSVIPLSNEIQKNKELSQTIYKDNMAEPVPSLSSETTQSLSIRSDRSTRLTKKNNNQQLNLQPQARASSFEDSLNFTPVTTKPTNNRRPSTATTSRKIAPDNEPFIINHKVEIVQQTTKTTMQPPQQKPSSENIASQKAVQARLKAQQKAAARVAQETTESKLEILKYQKTSFSAQ